MAYYHSNPEAYKLKFRRLWGKKASKKARHKRAKARYNERLARLWAAALGGVEL